MAKKVVHPKYNFFTYEYDLALVRLESSLTFAPHISPICLPATDDLLIGENATVTGWGRLSEGGTLPSVLQEVKLRESVFSVFFQSLVFQPLFNTLISLLFICIGIFQSFTLDTCFFFFLLSWGGLVYICSSRCSNRLQNYVKLIDSKIIEFQLRQLKGLDMFGAIVTIRL